MPDQSTILSLPYILPAQAQKHVTHNEALRLLDVMVQLSVADRTRTVPPGAPVPGARHIVAAGASDDWAGQDGAVAFFEVGGWAFLAPLPGWQAHVLAEAAVVTWTGTAWTGPADGPLQVARLGVSAGPDATNRLSVSSPAVLLNHAGAGHQVKVNKAAAGDTASLLFQTGFSGRAEMGTTGSDDFAIKVSADGSSYAEALKVARATGMVTLPAPVVLAGQVSDPASPENGTLWHDQTQQRIKAQIGGAVHVLSGQTALPMLVPPAGEHVQTGTGTGGTTLGSRAGTANLMEIAPFVARADLAMDQVALRVATGIAAATCKVVLYAADANGRPDALIAETATIDCSASGIVSAALAQVLLRGRTYWFGVRHSSTATLSVMPVGAVPDINGGAPVTTGRKSLQRSLTYATAAPATWGYVSSELTAAVPNAVWLRMA